MTHLLHFRTYRKVIQTVVRYLRAIHVWTLGIWHDWRIAANGGRYLRVLYDLDMWLRGRIKWDDLPEDLETALDGVRDKIRDLCDDQGVSLFDWE